MPVIITSSGPETASRLILLGAPVESYLLRESYVAQQGALVILTSSGWVKNAPWWALGFLLT